MHRDSITVLITPKDRHASKRIVKRDDGRIDVLAFDAGALFGFLIRDVTDIVSLSNLLQGIEALPKALVIRGAPRTGLERCMPVLRRKANFLTPASGRCWVMIDCDKIPLPPGLLLGHDVAVACEFLVGLLPPEFHSVTYHWQLSSSAGFTDPSVVSMHLWFWLDRPVPDAALKEWAKDWNVKAGRKVIDPALFNDVQPHYTAAPTIVGIADPFPVRSGLTAKAMNAVAIRLPVPVAKPRVITHGAESGVRPGRGLETILGQIGDHAGGQGFHEPIIRAVASHVAKNGAEVNVEALYEIVRDRVLTADRSHHDERYVNEMASREHVMPAIHTAIKKYGTPESPRRKSRQIQGIAPHFESKRTSAERAYSLLKAEIGKFFR